jgi:uncharacterized protein (TIGR02246 family)
VSDPEARGALAAQVRAWNDGDLDGFCAWLADDTVRVGASGVAVGRAAVRAAYAAAYPTPDAMGRLEVTVVQVTADGDRAVQVVRWSVGARGGHALLVWGRAPAGWRLQWDATVAGP